MRRYFLYVLIPIVLGANAKAQVLQQIMYGESSTTEIMSKIDKTSDGGYICVGSAEVSDVEHAYIVKLDSNLEIEWSRKYGNSYDQFALDVEETSDFGFIISGYTRRPASADRDVLLIKLDADGDSIWTRSYGGSMAEQGYAVVESDNGGYLVAGSTTSYGSGGDAFLLKTDVDGNLIWFKTYGGTDYDAIRAITKSSNGGYLLVGFGNTGALKVDSNGVLEWNKSYSALSITDVHNGITGGYICTGYGGPGVIDPFLVRLNNSGDVIWAKSYGGSEEGATYGVEELSDGGYIVVGWAVDLGPSGMGNVLVFRTDSIGDTLWTTVFAGSSTNWEAGRDVYQLSGGGFIIFASNNWKLGSFELDGLIIQIDGDGNGYCSQYSISPEVISHTIITTSPSLSVASVAIVTESGFAQYPDASSTTSLCLCGAAVADFNYAFTSQFNFTNTSQVANNWSWDFGDGNTSTDQNPIHAYTDTGYFEVCLIAYNDCDFNTFCDSLFVNGSMAGLEETNGSKSLHLYPNPASSFVNISNMKPPPISIELYNSIGALVKVYHHSESLSIIDLKPGIYFLRALNENGSAMTGEVIKLQH